MALQEALACGLPQAWAPGSGSSLAWLLALGRCAPQQENLLLRPEQGGLIADSQPGSKAQPALGWVICAQRGLWLLCSCQLIRQLSSGLQEHTPGSGNAPRNRSSPSYPVSTWHLMWRMGRGPASPRFKDSWGPVLSTKSPLSLPQRGLRLEAPSPLFGGHQEQSPDSDLLLSV